MELNLPQPEVPVIPIAIPPRPLNFAFAVNADTDRKLVVVVWHDESGIKFIHIPATQAYQLAAQLTTAAKRAESGLVIASLANDAIRKIVTE